MIIAAGSASGVIIICTTLALIIIAVVRLVHLKRKKKALHYTSNIAYASHDINGQCTEVENYSVSQPQAISNIVQNVAYITIKPGEIPLSSNVAYESHVHQSTDSHDEYDYII